MKTLLIANDALTVQIAYPGGWLLFFFMLFLTGAVVTYFILAAMGRYVCEHGEFRKDPETLLPKEAAISLFTFYSGPRLAAFYSGLPARSMGVLKKCLRFDYWFMLCLYPALSCLALWLVNYAFGDPAALGGTIRNSGVTQATYALHPLLPFIPLAIWLADVLENYFALRTWTQFTNAEANKGIENTDVILMRSFAGLKWLLALCYAIPASALLLYFIITYIAGLDSPGGIPFIAYLVFTTVVFLGLFARMCLIQFRSRKPESTAVAAA